MRGTSFPEQTHVLGAPRNWDSERDGECVGLAVHRTESEFISRWKPTWKERLMLLFGCPVWVWVFSGAHPPISLEVHRTIFRTLPDVPAAQQPNWPV